MDNKKLIRTLQISPTQRTASLVLDKVSDDGAYSSIIDNNVNNKHATLHMIDIWLHDNPKHETDYIRMIERIKSLKHYHWFNQSDLQPVSASDVIDILENI